MFKRLVAVALFALAVSAAQPAHASTPLTINAFVCEQTGANPWSGTGTVFCDAEVSGGTGSYSGYTWSFTVEGSTTTYTTTDKVTWRSCTIGSYTVARLTVTDSAGTTVTSRTTFNCLGGIYSNGRPY